MLDKNNELIEIIIRFSKSGWDVIEVPSTAWLKAKDDNNLSQNIVTDLIEAIKKAANSIHYIKEHYCFLIKLYKIKLLKFNIITLSFMS